MCGFFVTDRGIEPRHPISCLFYCVASDTKLTCKNLSVVMACPPTRKAKHSNCVNTNDKNK